jgi:hypothetical protein
MKKILLLFLLGIITGSLHLMAQSEINAFVNGGSVYSTSSATDYQCIGINPANLGLPAYEEESVFSFGFLEFSFLSYSSAMTRKQMNKEFLGGSGVFLENDQKYQAAQDFKDKCLCFDMNLTTAGIAYQHTEAGGFAFSVRDRVTGNFMLDNGPMAEILFMGYNAPYFDEKKYLETDSAIGYATHPKKYSEILGDSRLSFSWYREFNFSYGRRVWGDQDWLILLGAGLKYNIGYGIFDINNDGDEFSAYSSLSPLFEIDYGEAVTPSQVSGTGMKKVGQGFGFDIGLNVKFREWSLGLAINDIGSMTWDGNVYQGIDTVFWSLNTPGFDNYDIFQQAPRMFESEGVFEWEGLKEKKVSLPTNFRAGLHRKIAEKWEAGTDLLFPMVNEGGAPENMIWALGGKYEPTDGLVFSMGFSGGGNGSFRIPLGFAYTTPTKNYTIGFATRNVNYFTKKHPTTSLVMGFLRFQAL